MKLKKYIAIFLLLTMFTLLSVSCKKGEDIDPAQTGDTTAAIITEETSAENLPVTVAPVSEEETTEDNFEYQSDSAQYIGQIESEIYGRLDFYFQDNHFAIFDEYESMIFTLNAQGYTPLESEDEESSSISNEDLNFDGYSDLSIIYKKTTLNTYYLCWLWDMSLKTYVYYEPLTAIPSPVFDSTEKNVVSTNCSSAYSATVTTYTWQDGELYPVSHDTVNSEDEITTASGPEAADSSIAISDGMSLSTVTLTGNALSTSKWICKIEDESIVKLYYETCDETSGTSSFTFRGQKAGTTTVVFRYAKSWTSDYISEKVVNITVKNDGTLSIVTTK